LRPTFHHPRVTAQLLALATCSAALAPISSIQAKESAEQKNNSGSDDEKSASAFPALDILPEGSILQHVRLPRYDKNYHPISLLTADVLTVLDTHRIDGKNVSIEVYNQRGDVQMHSDMHHAVYNQKDSTLHATEAITIKGDSFQAAGTGLIFRWHTNRGFLLGPATSQFIINPPDTSSAMQLSPASPLSIRSLSLAGALISLTSSLTTTLVAEPPRRLTPAELSELDKLTQSSQSAIKQKQRETATTLSEEKQMIDSTNATMRPFLQDIGQGNLIVKNETSTSSTSAKPKPTPPKTSTAKPTTPPEPPQLLNIECDGGIYFDSDEGVLAYLKNIRLKDPRFKLTCSEELKVILEKKPEEPATAKKPANSKDQPSTPVEIDTTKKTPPAKVEDNSMTSSFGDLKRIIAIGNVRVVSTDEKGNTFIATAETASYDAKTEEMILRGGLPRIQYGPNQFLQSKAPGQYIRMLKNGKLVTTGKWAMQIDTSKKKTTP